MYINDIEQFALRKAMEAEANAHDAKMWWDECQRLNNEITRLKDNINALIKQMEDSDNAK